MDTAMLSERSQAVNTEPYICCQNCGHVWMEPIELPSKCENCKSVDLTSWVMLEAAEEHSDYVCDGMASRP